jgi:hypothetical protein
MYNIIRDITRRVFTELFKMRRKRICAWLPARAQITKRGESHLLCVRPAPCPVLGWTRIFNEIGPQPSALNKVLTLIINKMMPTKEIVWSGFGMCDDNLHKSGDATVRRVDEQPSVDIPTTLAFGGADAPLSPLL